MTSLNDPTPAFDSVPSNQHFGLKLLSHSTDHAEVMMPVRPPYLQETGVVHGGVLAVLADTTAVYALLPSLPPSKTMASIEFKLNFLQPATMTDDLRARAEVVKRGRRVAVCDAAVFQGDEAVARGIFTYLILEKKE